MRLYLSSFRMGDHPERLVSLLGRGRSAAVIANAIDDASAQEREDGLRRELDALAAFDIDAEELDLRDYFERPDRLPDDLRRYGLVWLRGGNVFLLRYALAASGADRVLVALLEQDALVYGGYSAGPCVLGPTLRGFELVDDPDEVRRIYGVPPISDGLAVLDYVIVPHVDSPEHPETERCAALAERLRIDGVPYRTLRDGEAIVVDGSEELIERS
jgi:dipeptidase E